MAQLIIFRHGQSVWNFENRFTGWADIGLTDKGIEEAKDAGEKLKSFKFDKGYASALKRTQESLLIALKVCGQENIPIVCSQALNERNYGDLQGLNKSETAEKYGVDQVMKWRRGYDISPPKGESLKDTVNRVVPYFEKVIMPELKENKNIVISSHGNTMRAILMYLENISQEEIVKMEFKTGEMILFEFDNNLKILNKINL
jgi:2,3-bisphosphoglycerate-dependent phosphoglycerate mutase